MMFQINPLSFQLQFNFPQGRRQHDFVTGGGGGAVNLRVAIINHLGVLVAPCGAQPALTCMVWVDYRQMMQNVAKMLQCSISKGGLSHFSGVPRGALPQTTP